VRDGDKRVITVQDGEPKDRHVVIVDDLVQTGGTLYECGVALKGLGAASVSTFAAHAVFPNTAWKRCVGARGFTHTPPPHPSPPAPGLAVPTYGR
jgi:phosphoribosylpyrophosphate synthetase